MTQRVAYQTRQQEAVERLFASHPEECLTPEEAYQALTSAGMDVGKTTVYRAITKLCQSGRLRRYASQERGEAAHGELPKGPHRCPLLPHCFSAQGQGKLLLALN